MKRLYPELRRIEDFETAREFLKRAIGRSGFFPALLVSVLVLIAVFGIAGNALIHTLETVAAAFGWGWGGKGAIIYALTLAYSVGFYCLFHKRIRRKLREELVRSGVPTCIHCGYDLRSASKPRCPECGKPMQS